MEIEDLYTAVADLIAEVPQIKWVDMDFGQVDNFDIRPAVAFPCALIGIDFPQITDLGQKKQKPQVVINIKMGFNYSGETAHATPEQVRERALAYYGIVKAVYKKLQGERIGTSTLKRRQQLETARPDRIKIIEMPFATEFVDESAAC